MTYDEWKCTPPDVGEPDTDEDDAMPQPTSHPTPRSATTCACGRPKPADRDQCSPCSWGWTAPPTTARTP